MAEVPDGNSPSSPVEVTECSVLYNGNDVHAEKVSTVIEEAIENTGISTTKVSVYADREELKKEAENVSTRALVCVFTSEMSNDRNKVTLLEFLQSAAEGINRIVTITSEVPEESVLRELQAYDMLSYEDRQFNEKLTDILKDWQNGSSPPTYLPSSSSKDYKVPFQANIEVHSLKSRNKNKTLASDLKIMRSALTNLLQDSDSTLSKALDQNYLVVITTVSKNPLKVTGKVKDEAAWKSLEQKIENKTIGSLCKEHVLKSLNKEARDLQYEIRIKPIHQQQQSSDEFARGLQNIISNVIFEIVKNKDYTPYDLYSILVKHRANTDLTQLKSDTDRFNIMHAIIVFNRLNLLMVLVHLKLFSPLMDQQVPDNSPSTFRGQTPRQIIQSKRIKRLQDQYMSFERLVTTLSKFLKACHAGDKEKVSQMLRQQPMVIHERDCMKNSCLYWAIVADSLEVFDLLLESGADASVLNENKETLLHVACMLGHSQFIKRLLLKCKQDVTAICSQKRTPLERVAENGDVPSLKELLNENVNLTNCVLPYAASCGRLALIKYILEESHASVDVDMRDNAGRSALMKACEAGKQDIFTYLLGKGAVVKVEDLRKRTPLHVACENGHFNLVKLLLDKGAEIDAQDCYTGAELCFLIRGKDKGRKAWHYVEVRRNVVHIFLKKTRAGQVDVALYGTVVKSGWGEDPEKPTVEWVEKMFADRRNRTNAPPDLCPLSMAIYKQHPDIAKLLIERGAQLELKDQFGLTPFMMSAMRNDKATAAMLEEKKVNMELKDNAGNTALEIAELNDQTDMIHFLKGRNYYKHTADFLSGPLSSLREQLGQEQLERLRGDGEDVRRHIIDSLRLLTNDINGLLYTLGSGPIMRASGEGSSAAGGQGYEESSGISIPETREPPPGVHDFGTQRIIAQEETEAPREEPEPDRDPEPGHDAEPGRNQQASNDPGYDSISETLDDNNQQGF